MLAFGESGKCIQECFIPFLQLLCELKVLPNSKGKIIYVGLNFLRGELEKEEECSFPLSPPFPLLAHPWLWKALWCPEFPWKLRWETLQGAPCRYHHISKSPEPNTTRGSRNDWLNEHKEIATEIVGKPHLWCSIYKVGSTVPLLYNGWVRMRGRRQQKSKIHFFPGLFLLRRKGDWACTAELAWNDSASLDGVKMGTHSRYYVSQHPRSLLDPA